MQEEALIPQRKVHDTGAVTTSKVVFLMLEKYVFGMDIRKIVEELVNVVVPVLWMAAADHHGSNIITVRLFQYLVTISGNTICLMHYERCALHQNGAIIRKFATRYKMSRQMRAGFRMLGHAKNAKAWTSHYAKMLPEHVEVNGPVKVGQARQEADRVRNLLLALLAKKTVYERACARTRDGPESGGAPPEGTSKGDVALTALVSRLNNWNPARDHGGAVIDLLRPKDHICNANVKGLQAICWPLDHWNDGRWQKHGPALRQWVCHAVLPAAKTCSSVRAIKQLPTLASAQNG